MPENFYDLLGVDEDATSDELKRAYRQRAREYHPDVNADDRAGTQFKTVRRAYDVLRDETERSAYDRLGHETYVRKRMKGLPSSSSSSSSASSSSSTSDSASSPSSRRSSASASSRSASSSSASQSSSRTSEKQSERQNRTRQQSANTATSTTSSTTGTTRSSTRRQASTNATTDRSTNGGGTTRSSGTTDRQYQPRESSTSSGRRTRLRHRWLAVFVALGVYLAGLGQYALTDRGAAESLVARLAATPVSALATGWGLGTPTAFVQTLVVDPSPALLFPLGAVLLPVALALTVFTFGRGAAWLYLLGALGPLVGLLAGSLLPDAAGVDLALFVGLPVVAALVFLGDVGRYLVATR